jgi:hypothetical protein
LICNPNYDGINTPGIKKVYRIRRGITMDFRNDALSTEILKAIGKNGLQLTLHNLKHL